MAVPNQGDIITPFDQIKVRENRRSIVGKTVADKYGIADLAGRGAHGVVPHAFVNSVDTFALHHRLVQGDAGNDQPLALCQIGMHRQRLDELGQFLWLVLGVFLPPEIGNGIQWQGDYIDVNCHDGSNQKIINPAKSH